MDMKSLSAATFQFLFVLFSISWASCSADPHESFLQCLYLQSDNSTSISKLIYTQINSTYSSVLNSSISNLRFSTPSTPKPLVIVTPLDVSHIQATIHCSRRHGLQIRIRSGGHDFEGLSFVSPVPFVILDMLNLRSISIDVETKTAWVQSGATLGELYYSIANKSKTLAFPAGSCPTVGVGGHFSGGGWGILFRKYGLAADNVMDAQFIDINGRIVDRESMGEDLFWAIRGGGGNSFGVVLAWRINLVPVPPTMTFCTASRTLEQNGTQLVHRWQQIADKLHEDLLTMATLSRANSSEAGNRAMVASFIPVFLGGVDRLIPMMQQSFPELGLKTEDCVETNWIGAILLLAGFPFGQSPEVLLDRSQENPGSFKAKSDYLQEAMPEFAFEGIWERFSEEEGKSAFILMIPYGGKMSEISEHATPFPHRAGYICKIIYVTTWIEEGTQVSQRHINWTRRIYSYMAPYVSKNPRQAYVNYRDLDIGVNNVKGYTSYKQASIWGTKYFKNNFDRLVRVKTMIDPINFFRNEQSIPPLTSW